MSVQGKGFEVVLASPPEYEELTAEIFFDGKFVALVNQERGLDQLELEIPSTDTAEKYLARKVKLRGFLEAVKTAEDRLRGKIQ